MILDREQLTLRTWRRDDAPVLAAACGDPDITRHTTIPATYSRPAAEAWIANQLQRTSSGEALILAVVPNDTREPVGMAGLFGLGEIDGPRLGYWIVREQRGRGLASEAAALLVSWAGARGYPTVTVEVEPQNVASRAVASRLGATLRDRRTVRLDGGRTVELDRFLVRPRRRALHDRD
jgi:RimJ/RimL family protein N-acetyltransferase